MFVISEVKSEVIANEDGSIVFITVSIEGYGTTKIGLRTSQIRILLKTLLAAANLAQGHGATNALDLKHTLNLNGISAFRPTEFELCQVELPEETLAIIRLKRDSLHVFDLVLDFKSTEQLGAALVEFAQTGPLEYAPHQ